MEILIIEDEPVAAKRLADLVGEVAPDSQIIATLDSVRSSVDWFNQHGMPDLVLMDIHLLDGSSFSIFDLVDVTAPIIFCTAYDEYALKAFQSNGIGYLLKPISADDLRAALQKLMRLCSGEKQTIHSENRISRTVMSRLGGGPSTYKSRFLVRAGNRLIPVSISDITIFMADSHGVRLYLENGDNYYVDFTVAELEELLDPQHFFRISRQVIVAAKAITEATANLRQTLVTISGQDTPQSVSRDRAKAFRLWLDR